MAAIGSASTYPVRAQLTGDAADVRSGMAADVTFRFQDEGRDDRLLVPGLSVGEDAEGRFVFVLEPEGAEAGIVRRRPVVIGEIQGGIEIVDGLEPGELVVTAGVRRLVDGMRVRMAPESGP